jgi:hypothetical protein
MSDGEALRRLRFFSELTDEDLIRVANIVNDALLLPGKRWSNEARIRAGSS